MRLNTATRMLALTLTAASAAFATEASMPGGGELATACKGDVEKFCPDVKPGDGRLKSCLKDHRAALSKECKAAARQARKSR